MRYNPTLPKLGRMKFSFVRVSAFLFGILLQSSLFAAKPFQVVAYNVENLFDTDGISLYDDYKSDAYGETEFQNKLDTIIKVLQKIGGVTGPEVLLLQEVEVDRSPNDQTSAAESLLDELHRNGLGPYNIALGYNSSFPSESWPAVQCLTLSKFPIKTIRLHSLYRARPILETTILVEQIPFTLFNNHWKSGASSSEMEKIRLQNAEILRKRIDNLLQADPYHDFLVGGDLNSHYNQSVIYRRELESSGINDILLSGNQEPAGKLHPTRSLYNLWHELEVEERGSDAWKGKWGTLMHLLLPVGLYDGEGIGYVSDSFSVGKFSGLNMTKGGKVPFKWSNELDGFGASDHFPVYAMFQVEGERPEKGKTFPIIETTERQVDFSEAEKEAQIWKPQSLKPENYGTAFKFKGKIAKTQPLFLEAGGHRLGLFSFDSEIRKKLFSKSMGETISGIGLLSRYRGQWQFIIEKKEWLK